MSFQKYNPDVCRAILFDLGDLNRDIVFHAMIDQYEKETARLEKKYIVNDPKLKERISSALLSVKKKLDGAINNWRAFLFGGRILMSKCNRLVKDADLAAIVKGFDDSVKKLLGKARKFYPLQVIDRKRFNEEQMDSYIDGYEAAAKAQYSKWPRIYPGRLGRIVKEARLTTRPSNEGHEGDNFKTLQVLVDSLNSYGANMTT